MEPSVACLSILLVSLALSLAVVPTFAAEREPEDPLCISGVYPHLTAFNAVEGPDGVRAHDECGIGAVVPWAGRLWFVTYSAHEPRGGNDKLYSIDDDLNLTIHPESIGGTPAGRLIHRESEQLFIGPYAIDAEGNVRVIPYSRMPGRHTAVARHLEDSANKVYYFDMEGAVFEVDVHSLEVEKLFQSPVPGNHGKGGYTGQGRFIIANNGAGGALAEWDGREWRMIERKQFTDVTGPGGIYGAPDEESPVWSIGWDERSVILKLLDGGDWHTFRLPKATHTYDHEGGWYTEWPRIREIAPDMLMMDMHGMFWDFPKGFDSDDTGGIRPLSTHLRYIPDFCHWNGRVVLATDETSMQGNPFVGQPQSNFWFGTVEDLYECGPPAGRGGPWLDDPVEAGEPSVPYLINGFTRRCVHLSADRAVTFTLETDAEGRGEWRQHAIVQVPAGGYRYHLIPPELEAAWMRVRADADCRATAFFHAGSPGDRRDERLFAALARAEEEGVVGGLLRPARHNRNLQFLAHRAGPDGEVEETYYEVDKELRFGRPDVDRAEEVRRICRVKKEFEVDRASVIMNHKGRRYRLPKGHPRFDRPFAAGRPRCIRECESERYLMNVHGTFYELPREAGLPRIRPLATHNRRIMDFCTWRGLLVFSGTREDAEADGHYFQAEGGPGLWFGAIDDVWKLGRPVGHGGPWLEAPVEAGQASDPYLMTGYDRKTLDLSHDAPEEVTFTIEVDVDYHGWHTYGTIPVPAGQGVTHHFPEGYGVHWVRFRADESCTATALLTYE